MNVLGIDVSTHHVDMVKLPLDNDRAEWTRYSAQGRLAEDRLFDFRAALPGAASYWWDDVCLVALERPAARHRTTVESLMAVLGLVVGTIPTRLKPWLFMPAEWRRECGMAGNASKQDVDTFALATMAAVEGMVRFSWPQDAMDAFGIAYAARAVNAKADAA